ncbi:MAG: DNA protecting protein DprA [Microbacterium sp. 69-10]|uniref:DNA-processing protein DprA n=1 Tax=Microbacterium sp. 69-10 TaxID=1895783 RepID=UPI00095D1124|nr:DNA-processing protein DprA [Microbacterium sp. 69-10]OJU41489.1 MAG: DNA protecting protein DprA [Microbacterium sp. 69-10]
MVTITSLAKDERSARIVLAATAEPNDSRTGRLIAAVGAVDTVRLAQSDGALPTVLDSMEGELWRRQLAPRLLVPVVETARRETDKFGLHVLIPGDKDWPTGLDALGDREPVALWTKGASSLLSMPLRDRVTISGARAATSYGVQVTTELAGELSNEELFIVSGGAYGVDAAAHKAALSVGGSTIAVMAGGLDRPYPSGNSDLLSRVADLGVLVSEMPPGAAPTKWRFLARNRIMAALSAATIIPEAGYRSGSLHVAKEARDLGRPVGAVPGPITSAASAGTHRLIREGVARIVTMTQDVREMVEDPRPSTGRSFGVASPAQRRAAPSSSPQRSL